MEIEKAILCGKFKDFIYFYNRLSFKSNKYELVSMREEMKSYQLII